MRNIGCERLTFNDANCREHAEPVRTGEVVALTVHQQLELIPDAAIADRQHVDGDTRGSGNFIGLALASPFSG